MRSSSGLNWNLMSKPGPGIQPAASNRQELKRQRSLTSDACAIVSPVTKYLIYVLQVSAKHWTQRGDCQQLLQTGVNLSVTREKVVYLNQSCGCTAVLPSVALFLWFSQHFSQGFPYISLFLPLCTAALCCSPAFLSPRWRVQCHRLYFLCTLPARKRRKEGDTEGVAAG